VRVDLPPALAALFSERNNESGYLIADAAGKPVLGSQPVCRCCGGGPVGEASWRIFVLQGREELEALGHSLIREFLTTGLVLLILIGAVAILIAASTVRQGLAPARAASAAALAIGPFRPGLRLPEERQPAEIAPMVRAVNQAVARLEDALTAQRRFVGDAAHTLRTPLAVLMARLDSLPESAEKAGLRQDADRMARLVGQMLQMARIEGAPLDVSGEIEVREVGREVIAMLRPLAVRRGVELALTGGDAPGRILGNRAAVVVALENLIDNALRYAPAGSTV
jgi:two-component system, OmpR family, sensor histidine kinase TctE